MSNELWKANVMFHTFFIYSHMDTKYKLINTGDWGLPSKLPNLRSSYHKTMTLYDAKNISLHSSVCMHFAMNFIRRINPLPLTKGLHDQLLAQITRNVSVDKKNQLDVTFCIIYFSFNSCSTCFGQPCAHHQELTTAWSYSLVLVCAVAAGRLSSPVGK